MPRLTELAVASLKPDPERRLETADDKVTGLYLVTQSSGVKSWALRYRAKGRPTKLTIGRYPALELKAARQRARELIADIGRGKDPSAERRTAKLGLAAGGPLTVARLVGLYCARKPLTKKIGAGRLKEIARLLRHDIAPAIGKIPAAELTRAEVKDRLLYPVLERGAATLCNRLLAVLKAVYRWGVEEELLAVDPLSAMRKLTKEERRDRVLSDAELGRVWRAFELEGYPFGDAFRLLALTGARRGEVAGMAWSELDLEAATWLLPASRSKNGHEHLVPLSDSALEILRSLPRFAGSDAVFTLSGRAISGFARAKERADRTIAADGGDPIKPWVTHDLRRSTATGLQRLGIAVPVIEAVLNHTTGLAGVGGVYRRHAHETEKRQALSAWAAHVMAIVAGEKPPSNVVAIGERRGTA
jgi:integrase